MTRASGDSRPGDCVCQHLHGYNGVVQAGRQQAEAVLAS